MSEDIEVSGQDVRGVPADALLSAEALAARVDEAYAKRGKYPLDSGAGIDSGAAIELTVAARITKAGLLDALVTAARDLKAAEVEHRACQERYAAAVRALSEEAVK